MILALKQGAREATPTVDLVMEEVPVRNTSRMFSSG